MVSCDIFPETTCYAGRRRPVSRQHQLVNPWRGHQPESLPANARDATLQKGFGSGKEDGGALRLVLTRGSSSLRSRNRTRHRCVFGPHLFVLPPLANSHATRSAKPNGGGGGGGAGAGTPPSFSGSERLRRTPFRASNARALSLSRPSHLCLFSVLLCRIRKCSGDRRTSSWAPESFLRRRFVAAAPRPSYNFLLCLCPLTWSAWFWCAVNV
jgi:hypothetical protein